jgi:DNA-binding MarR family transcriptional regulator
MPRPRSPSKVGCPPNDPAERRGRRPNDRDYERLLELRTGLRRFLRWSEDQARAAHLTPVQHQLLLAVRGHPDSGGPTIGELASYLVLRHHSVVGLVDRATSAGLVTRAPDTERPGTVRVRLTALGAQRLQALSELHLQELSRLAPTMEALWHALAEARTGGK